MAEEMTSLKDIQKLTSAIESLEKTVKSMPSVPSTSMVHRQAALPHNSPLRRLSNVGMLSLEEDYTNDNDTPVAAKVRELFLHVL